MALDKARFVIVPGNAGTEVTPELQRLASGDDVAPWARVVHEQWIKHCFRDQCVLSPDDYLAHPSEAVPADELESEYANTDDDGASDVPPREALVRVNQIIKTVRKWKAGNTKSNFTTVYNFVDNLWNTQVSCCSQPSADRPGHQGCSEPVP